MKYTKPTDGPTIMRLRPEKRDALARLRWRHTPKEHRRVVGGVRYISFMLCGWVRITSLSEAQCLHGVEIKALLRHNAKWGGRETRYLAQAELRRRRAERTFEGVVYHRYRVRFRTEEGKARQLTLWSPGRPWVFEEVSRALDARGDVPKSARVLIEAVS